MPVETYYLSKTRVGILGAVFFLKQLQKEDASGGGRALLGSVVPEIDKRFGTDYVIPNCLSAPQAILKELEKRREQLGIEGDVTLRNEIAAGSETVRIEKKKAFEVGVAPFPLIPLNSKIDIDYAKMSSVTMVYGDDTYYEYIPLGYMHNLYHALRGDPKADGAQIGGDLLKKHAFVSQILLAKNYTVTFESTEDFKSDFEARLEAFKALPEIEGNVSIEKKTMRKVEAEVTGSSHYLIALASTQWQNLK